MTTNIRPYLASSGKAAPPLSIAYPELAAAIGSTRHYTHERAALASALDEGLMADEVARILGGRRVIEAFPVWQGESPTRYAARAVAEMFVAYLQ
ncbi:hypothetical protein [Methylobacterium sp. WL64]|uniref:hypothetical protein n=1 Tax=Methylobacterium sp. WL64 TaxID=2603894 RepID=UPI001FED7D77|nr:hypothetical protein [Methylobacterium sp. WL64]